MAVAAVVDEMLAQVAQVTLQQLAQARAILAEVRDLVKEEAVAEVQELLVETLQVQLAEPVALVPILQSLDLL